MNQQLDDLINSVGAHRPNRTAAGSSASQQLKHWWIAERQTPVLLKYQQQLLERVVAEIRRLRDHIEETSLMLLEDNAPEEVLYHDVKIELLVVETELERAKYIVRAYLRTRMAKIDRFPYFYLEQQQQEVGDVSAQPDISSQLSALGPLMSREEWIYCHRHSELRADHYGMSFLAAFPDELQDLTDQEGAIPMVERPDLETPVIIRVKRTPPNDGIIDVAGEAVQLEVGSIYILRYSNIMNLMDFVEIL